MDEWQEIEPAPWAAVTNLPSQGVFALQKYIYVVKKDGFVLKHKPDKLWKLKQFDITHADIGQELPIKANGDRMKPSEYLMH